VEVITSKVLWSAQKYLSQMTMDMFHFSVACDKVYQLLAHGRWFSPGTPASSTTKNGRHDIAEIFLKVILNTINQSNQSPPQIIVFQF
jgi:hypothetical protein